MEDFHDIWYFILTGHGLLCHKSNFRRYPGNEIEYGLSTGGKTVIPYYIADIGKYNEFK